MESFSSNSEINLQFIWSIQRVTLCHLWTPHFYHWLCIGHQNPFSALVVHNTWDFCDARYFVHQLKWCCTSFCFFFFGRQHEKSFSMTMEGKLQDVEVVSMDMVWETSVWFWMLGWFLPTICQQVAWICVQAYVRGKSYVLFLKKTCLHFLILFD